VPDIHFGDSLQTLKYMSNTTYIQRDLVLDIIQHNVCGENVQHIEYIFILMRMPLPILLAMDIIMG
jgi:hypothetical protein